MAKTARETRDERLAEARRIVARITKAIEATQASDAAVHWGHTGDALELVKKLRGAAHWAGIPGNEDA